jgi:hypothetical protein
MLDVKTIGQCRNNINCLNDFIDIITTSKQLDETKKERAVKAVQKDIDRYQGKIDTMVAARLLQAIFETK